MRKILIFVGVLACLMPAMLTASRSSSKLKITPEDISVLASANSFDEGELDTFIPKGTTIPFNMTKEYGSDEDYQPLVLITIYEGKDMTDRDCLLDGIIMGIPSPKKKGEETFVVTMQLEEDVLYVTGTLKSTGTSLKLSIERPIN